MRQAYGGPLFGEGGEGANRFDSYFAGAVDGVERQVERRWRARVVPDFELLAVKPRMLNHGMGYYSRYWVESASRRPRPGQNDLDQYRATEIAFGHAGFLGDDTAGVLKLGPLPRAGVLADAGQQRATPMRRRWRSPSMTAAPGATPEGALRADSPLERARLKVEYAGGLVVQVNRDSPSRSTSSTLDFAHEQGSGGWRYWEEQGSTLVPDELGPAQRALAGLADVPAALRERRCDWTCTLLSGRGARPPRQPCTRKGSIADQNTTCGDGVWPRSSRARRSCGSARCRRAAWRRAAHSTSPRALRPART